MEELPQRILDRLKKKDFILSEIFESPKADKNVAHNRVICEIFRTLYSLTIIDLKDKPELLKRHIDLLEEGFITGMRMVNRMVENNISFSFDSISEDQVIKENLYRAEQKRITNQLKHDVEFLERLRNVS